MNVYRFFLLALLFSACGSDTPPSRERGANTTKEQEKIIKIGSGNTCIVLEEGELKCWGNNATGQLGNGGTANLLIPTTIDTDVPIQSIAFGIDHACAIASDGAPTCWGQNGFGKLGDGSLNDSLTPVRATLPTGRKATRLSLGGHHSCALLDDGSLACWGQNTYGQLGDGTTNGSTTPLAIDLGDGMSAKAITAGLEHTCAILNDDSLVCWGLNGEGQLGDKTLINRNSPTPVDLPEGRSAKEIHTRNHHTCAILDDDSLYCWGRNDSGQLGNGNTTDTPIPTLVDFGEAKVQKIAIGGDFSCAQVGNYSLRCWGQNSFGQLGNGTTTDTSSPTSVSFPPGRKILSLQAGQYHTCTLTEDDDLLCWGWNPWGQLGLEDTTILTSTVPAAVNLNPSP